MRNKIHFFLICAFILIISCQEKELSQHQPDFSSFKLSLDGMNISLELADVNDQLQILGAIELLESEARSIIDREAEIEDVVYTIILEETKLTLSAVEMYSSKGKLLKDQSPNSRTTIFEEPVPYIAGDCPEGYDDLGSCSNIGNTADCVAEKVGDYYRDNLTGVGDCAQTRVKVGAFSTRVCGKTC
ncbi:MAG: hypothetical protein AAF600_20680 [Bacteroidota bacterium]